MIEELGRHGYKLSPGTLYPVLHHLERSGYLSCEGTVVSGKRPHNGKWRAVRCPKTGSKLAKPTLFKTTLASASSG